MTKVIPRNCTIPTKKSLTFTTTEDNQSSLRIKIFEGERSMVKDNNFLGEFCLDGLAPAPRGVPQIQVTFDIDANGILNVSAYDRACGKSNQTTITNNKGRLSQSEIDRMVKEAEMFMAEDKTQQSQAKAQASDSGICAPEDLPPRHGVANAARVSCGSLVDHWAGLTVKDPSRDKNTHCTITVQFYHVVVGGVPSPEDVIAAIDDMEDQYKSCTSWHGRLADEGADFMKSELTSEDVQGIASKLSAQPWCCQETGPIEEVD